MSRIIGLAAVGRVMGGGRPLISDSMCLHSAMPWSPFFSRTTKPRYILPAFSRRSYSSPVASPHRFVPFRRVASVFASLGQPATAMADHGERQAAFSPGRTSSASGSPRTRCTARSGLPAIFRTSMKIDGADNGNEDALSFDT